MQLTHFIHSIGQFPYSSKRMLAVTMFFGFGFCVFCVEQKPWSEEIHIYDTQLMCNPGTRTSGQRESFFQSRDENESFSDSISFIETRPRIPDTYSQASRRDREKISSNLGHRDEIEIYYLHSQTSRREREFP